MNNHVLTQANSPIQYQENSTEVQQISKVLFTLPLEKVVEVRDYVLFLQSRYVQSVTVDEGDTWSDEDLQDLTRAALVYAA